MDYALKERIGKPELFTGRKEELAFYYLRPEDKNNFEKVKAAAVKEGLDYLTGIIDSVEFSFVHGNVDILWDTVREAPMTVAYRQKEFIVQMIDEFQFLNAMIYRDRAMNILADTLAGGVYEEDIRDFSPKVIREEYNTELRLS